MDPQRLDPTLLHVAYLRHHARLLRERGVEVRIEAIGAATVFLCPALPRDIGCNRAFGVHAADTGSLLRILAAFQQRGIRALLEGSAASLSPAAHDLLIRRGLRHQWDVVALVAETVPGMVHPPTPVRIRAVTPAEATAFAELAVRAYDVPPEDRAAQRLHWSQRCADPLARAYVAAIDGTPAAVASMTILGTTAVLDGAATLPPWRRRGCQRALLAHRRHAAHALGATHLFVRTAAASESHRNLAWIGLRPTAHLAVWGEGPLAR